ncbi:MAG: response regulator, partial [Mangrovicoccus sp.]|nr:response regulator [Mangrovicoccus sp.]
MPATGVGETAARPFRRRAQLAALGIVLAVCIGVVATLAQLVHREIDEASIANSDNLQWSLSQVDVEFLRFQLALEHARADPAALDAVRRRFDIFYSRMTTLERGDVFTPLREDPRFDVPRGRVRGFLESTVPLVDGTDAELQGALDGLARRAEVIGEDVRSFSLAGLSAFAQISDRQRTELIHMLVTLSAVLAVLFSGLVLLAVSMLRLARIAEGRARQVQIAAARMRTIVETSPDAIVVTDPAGTIREFNRAAEAIFGHAAAEAVNRNAIDLLFPPGDGSDLRRGLLQFLEEGGRPAPEAHQFELTAVDRAGRRFPAEISVDCAVGEGERVAVAFIRDISRRKAAEDGLTEARDRALAGERAKAEFLAVMSHEMRTPLNGLLGTLQLMRDHSLTRRQSELLDRMEASGRSLLALVNDVLDLAKFEAGKMRAEARPFSLPRLVAGVVETAAPLAEAFGNELSWRWVGVPAETAIGDARRLRQVLLNLVGNAVKFTRGGSVEIEVELLGAGRDRLEIRVIDTGIGIAEADLDRIFNEFETLDTSYARQSGGTGLGLGIARRLTELMGGRIGVESEPGTGSLFWIRIPIQLAGAVLPADAAPVPEPRLPGPRLDLLLVEDNEFNRFVAREMLEAEGHRVTEAVDGQAGVDLAATRRFDAILMDISMPVMDGTEAARRIRSGGGASSAAPIIAVTAHALPEEIARFREAGMAQTISKPVDRDLMARVLAEVTGESRPPADPAADPGDVSASLPLLDEVQAAALWADLPAADRDRIVAHCCCSWRCRWCRT